MTLTAKQRSHLKGLGHHLKALLHVGHQGVTAELVKEANVLMERHELVKVKFAEHAPGDRRELAEQLAEGLSAEVAQVLGRTALLYRPRKEEPTIVLP